MKSGIFKPGSVFPATVQRGRRIVYHPDLEAIRGRAVSGVYAIIDAAAELVLYVGESHTDRLFDTITRHFRKWRVDPRNDPAGRRRGGTTYDRLEVSIAFAMTKRGEAQDAQYAEIQRLGPRDNNLDGSTVCCDDLPA